MAPLGKMGVARSGWPKHTPVAHEGGSATPWGQRAKKKKMLRGVWPLRATPKSHGGGWSLHTAFQLFKKKN